MKDIENNYTIFHLKNTKFSHLPNIFIPNSSLLMKHKIIKQKRIILLSQASILSSINKKRKEEKKINLSIFPRFTDLTRSSSPPPSSLGKSRAKDDREREKEHFSPSKGETTNEKRICIRVSVFKLSQCRVYMEIPRAMSPTKVPGIELNITVAQSWSSNRLPMVKWKYSWWKRVYLPLALSRSNVATRFIKIAFCAFRPRSNSTCC